MDTVAWYASVATDDVNHREARRRLERLSMSGRLLLTSNYVVSESYTLTRARKGAAQALRLISNIRSSTTIRLIRITEEWELAAEELLAKYREHVFSYVDATSFVAMRQLGVREALSFDTDFSIAGFRHFSG